MRVCWDAEFLIRIEDFSRIGELSDFQLTKLIREEEYTIQQAKRDGRLKQQTRNQRISDATSSRDKLSAELLFRIERRHHAKALTAFQVRARKRDNIHPFPQVRDAQAKRHN